MDRKLGHKTSLKFMKIEIISSMFFSQNGMKLEINNNKKTCKLIDVWSLNNMLLNNQWINKEIKGK